MVVHAYACVETRCRFRVLIEVMYGNARVFIYQEISVISLHEEPIMEAVNQYGRRRQNVVYIINNKIFVLYIPIIELRP